MAVNRLQKHLEYLSDLQTEESREYKKWLGEKLEKKVQDLDFSMHLTSDRQDAPDVDEKFRALLNMVFLKFDRKLQKDKRVHLRPLKDRTQWIFFPEVKSNLSLNNTVSHMHGVVSLPEDHALTDFELHQLLGNLSFWLDSSAMKLGLVRKRNRLNHKFSKQTKLKDEDSKYASAHYIIKQQGYDNAMGRAINFGELVRPESTS